MTDCKYKEEFLRPDENNLGFVLWRVMSLWQRERQKHLEEFNTTVSQLEILGGLHYLNKIKGEVTQIVLSQETGIDPMTTSTILRNLEKKELVVRRPSDTDTRARVVEPTEKGIKLLFKAIHKLHITQDNLLESIDQDLIKEELKKLLVKLEKRKD